MRNRCRLRSEIGRAEFDYFPDFLCYFKKKLLLPESLVFRPLVKGNEDSGNETGSSLGFVVVVALFDF